MCGRYVQTAFPDDLAEKFRLAARPDLQPRFNIAPSQDIPVVRRAKDGDRYCLPLRWGLIPFWSKDEKIGNRLINARSETVFEKPSFRAPIKKRRCLVPATGFYEWKKIGDKKQPYLIGLNDEPLFAMAGLWERWKASDTETIETYTILTTEPNAFMQDIHKRMPVILTPDDYDLWLDPQIEGPDDLQPLFAPIDAKRMQAVPVSRRVNNPKYDNKGCIEPVDAE